MATSRSSGWPAGWRGRPISPREATALDPQQRLVLELAWEALEDARLPAQRLADTDTGVFTVAMNDDYATLSRRRAGVPRRTR